MKLYEIVRQGFEPLLPPLYKQVRKSILRESRKAEQPLDILDVGGRKSPYTIGLPASVDLLDLPRNSDIQLALNLGVNEEMIDQIKVRRSNVNKVILADMTRSDLPTDRYDMVVSIEVLEHVEDDGRFVSEVSRVLKPDGIFLMTTPNGDFVENRNPDHKRHYKRKELEALLRLHFDDVEVEYAIAGGYFRRLGLRSWSARRPIWTLSSMFGNIINAAQSSRRNIPTQKLGTHHLIARARKAAVGVGTDSVK